MAAAVSAPFIFPNNLVAEPPMFSNLPFKPPACWLTPSIVSLASEASIAIRPNNVNNSANLIHLLFFGDLYRFVYCFFDFHNFIIA
nr:MAG TPA: hypothetical protein [Caudoviricetes sp.]